jgi:prepilin-type N-terminal cleavage/methylation domain-containing protein/prepilin-type processing-associated H-X9-DG protein
VIDTQESRGVTLLELLVVTSIIGLILAIVLPAASRAREESKGSVCLSHLRVLGAGFFLYAGNEDYFCSGQTDARPGMNLHPSVTDLDKIGIEQIGWVADLVNNRVALPGKMLCPSNVGRQTQSWGRALRVSGGASRYTPERFRLLTTVQGYNTNYAQSWFMIHTEYDGVTRPVLHADRMHGSKGPLRPEAMAAAGPQRVPLLGDARTKKGDVFDHSSQGYGPAVQETKSATDGPYWRITPDGTYAAVGYSSAAPYGIQDWDDFGPAHRPRRHPHEEGHRYTAGNILFGDGHAEAFADQYDFDNGRVKPGADGELDSWDLRERVFDGSLSIGQRSASVNRLE